MKTNIHLWSYLDHFFLEWKMFQIKFVEKFKIYLMLNNSFFFKSCHLWDKVEKYCTVGQATDDNMAHMRWMLEPRATNTNPEYVLIIACPPQQWSHDRVLMLC